MRGVDELRQTLVDHEDLAPDAVGLVEAAQQGATRIRRRRRAVYAACVAVAVASGVAVGPTAVGQLGRTINQDGSDTYRDPLQLTVDLVHDSGYFKLNYGLIGSTQFLNARWSDGGSAHFGATVAVHDPGTFDPASLERGEAVSVLEHSAYYVPDLRFGERESGPAIGWQDVSGAWVVVYQDHHHDEHAKDELIRVAEAVRLGTPRDVRAPYKLSYVPRDLPGTFALASDNPSLGTDSAVGLGGRPSLDSAVTPAFMAGKLPLVIRVLPRNHYVDKDLPELGAPTKIAGYDSWYVTDSSVLNPPPGGSVLVVNAGQCHVGITTKDRTQIPYGELKRLVEGAEFKDCNDPRTWVPPLP